MTNTSANQNATYMSYTRWILTAILLFGISLVLGLATPTNLTDFASEEIDSLKYLGGFLSSLPLAAVIIAIFIKNAFALLLSFIFSPFLCLLPILTLTINGWLIGLISAEVASYKSLGFVLAGLLPHGIFELPALILCEAAALSFGTAVILALFKSERRSQVLPSLKQNSKYLMIALALLLPAAIIETCVTPLLLP